MQKLTRKTRIMALLLVLVMLAGLVPDLLPDFLTTEAEAIYHEDNAPAASLDLLKQTEDNFAVLATGASFRIVDGKLYVWGINTDYALGLRTYRGAETTTTTVVDTPTELVYQDPNGVDGWGENHQGKVVKVGSDKYSNLMLCLTDDGSMYVWGTVDTNYWGAPYGRIIPYPTKIDTSNIPAGDKIVDYIGGGVGICALTKNGGVYVLGNCRYTNYICGTNFPNLGQSEGSPAFLPIAESWTDRFQNSYDKATGTVTNANERVNGSQRRTIKKIVFAGLSFTSFYIMSDNTLWTCNGTWGYYNFSGGNASWENPIPCMNTTVCPANADWVAAKPQLDTLKVISHLGMVIDEEGSVWACGTATTRDSQGRYWGIVGGYDRNNYQSLGAGIAPRKIYDATMTGAKCIKIYCDSWYNVAFLAEDNSLYTIGLNSNGFIDPTKDSRDPVLEPTQVFSDISREDTITGVYVSNMGIMLVNKSGEQYFSGDNSTGAAGIGNTSNAAPGEVIAAIPPNLPPVQPLTANELILEVETADGVRYRYDPTRDDPNNPDGQSYVKIDVNGTTTAVKYPSFINLNAGSIVKLNVYFHDFGRLNYFEIPIRFDPEYIQVVRGDGTSYDKNKVVTPGTLGASTGIIKQFTNSQWAGGVMVGDSVKNGGYPKICNGEGWVSVAGYTSDKTARINGEVKMFTICFTAIDTMVNITDFFTIANKDNIKAPPTVTGYGYDQAMAASDKGARWGVSSLLPEGTPGVFEFAYPRNNNGDMLTPAFRTTVTWINSLTLTVKSADGSALVGSDYTFVKKYLNGDPTMPDPTAQVSYFNVPQISYSNKTATFTVVTNVTPNESNPPAASFPEVNWTYQMHSLTEDAEANFDDGSGSGSSAEAGNDGNSGKWTIDDFVTVVSSNTSQLKFKVSEHYPENVPCVIRFTATTQRDQLGSTGMRPMDAYVDVVFRSFNPPATVRIAEHDSLANDTALWTDRTATIPGEPGKTFHCDFPDSEYGFEQVDVVWTLMDKDRNVLTGLDTDSIKLRTPSPANNPYLKPLADGEAYKAPSVTVDLQHTTFGDDYLILRVESAYDGSIYDEIFLKVHQRVTNISWKKDKLYMLENGGTVDLSSMITISPDGEYYKADLEYVYKGNSANTGSPFIYVSSTTGKVQPLNKSILNGSVVFDQVAVRDKISGTSTENNAQTAKYLNVAVISVNSLIKAEDVEVHNMLGTKSDYARVYNLQPGDSIIFFKDYDTAVSGSNGITGAITTAELASRLSALGSSNYKRFNNLTAEQLGSKNLYDFPLPDFLSGSGGDLGFMLLRKLNDDSPEPTVYDVVPVHYLSDPSKVYGYVQLLGKNPASYQNQGIGVKLVGPSTPATITTGANGYFVFQEYIIPGEYTMILTKDGYLDRTIQPDAASGYRGIVISEAVEFAISTYEDPILIYPGDMDNNGSINASDISTYVRNWYGQTDYLTIYDFARYDFYDLDGQNAINLYDLDTVVTHNGWTKNNYAKWNVPKVS